VTLTYWYIEDQAVKKKKGHIKSLASTSASPNHTSTTVNSVAVKSRGIQVHQRPILLGRPRPSWRTRFTREFAGHGPNIADPIYSDARPVDCSARLTASAVTRSSYWGFVCHEPDIMDWIYPDAHPQWISYVNRVLFIGHVRNAGSLGAGSLESTPESRRYDRHARGPTSALPGARCRLTICGGNHAPS
jgi:hypothetical protein